MESQARIKEFGIIEPGHRVRLREDAFKNVKTRDWVFAQMEKDDKVLLMHENGLYGLVVEISDIDWKAI